MAARITIIDGHPDPDRARLCHALADAYAAGAGRAGHQIHRIDLATLDFPDLDSREAWEAGAAPEEIGRVQGAIAWATHLVIIYPLWLGGMPGRLKSLFEQTLRPCFAFGGGRSGPGGGRLGGRSARVIVTMGMPAAVYWLWFFGHSVRSLKRNILGFVGVRPVRCTVIGGVEAQGETRLKRRLAAVEKLGERAG